MPTGYTSELMEKGQDFKTFVLRCARAFGPLVTMREDSLDTPIPKFEPTPFYQESINEAQKTLTKLTAATTRKRITFGQNKKDQILRELKKSLEKAEAEDARLDAMATKVTDWVPPTEDHQELKRFMLDQINISRNGIDWYKKEIAAVKHKAPVKFYAEAVTSAEHDIEYYTEERKKEISRVEWRNKWVRELRESLKP